MAAESKVPAILHPRGPYLIEHESPHGANDARPTALKVIRDQKLDGKLSGLVFLITGCTAGLGIETARAIHATGADVYITGRNDTIGQDVVKKLTADGKPGKVEFIHLELDSLESVRAGAADFLQRAGGRCNVLICNAGVMRTPEGVTRDGFETQFGTNHLGHFQLFLRVREALLASTTAAFQSRVVALTSAGHTYTEVLFDNYDQKKSPNGYDPTIAYGQSKTANVYMANGIERRYGSRGLHALSVHPGGILETGLGKYSEDVFAVALSKPNIVARLKSIPQGAATSVWAAVGEEWEGKGGRYLEDCQEAAPWQPQEGLLNVGYKPYAYDEAKEERLWKESLALLGEPAE